MISAQRNNLHLLLRRLLRVPNAIPLPPAKVAAVDSNLDRRATITSSSISTVFIEKQSDITTSTITLALSFFWQLLESSRRPLRPDLWDWSDPQVWLRWLKIPGRNTTSWKVNWRLSAE